jgi:DNA-binding response OmpR family regulator
MNRYLDTKRLLVLDDEPEIGEIVGQIMEPNHIEYYPAVNAQDALNRLKEVEIHTIVCDLNMPGVDGFSFFEQLKKEGYRVPFLIVTARSSASVLKRAIQLGASDFIEKPFEAELIQARIEHFLEIGMRKSRLRKHIKDAILPELSTSDRLKLIERVNAELNLVSLLESKI